MGTLKNEMLQGGAFADDTDARIEIFDFIESYYNHHRKHSSLGYQTPAQFEAANPSKNQPTPVQKSVAPQPPPVAKVGIGRSGVGRFVPGRRRGRSW